MYIEEFQYRVLPQLMELSPEDRERLLDEFSTKIAFEGRKSEIPPVGYYRKMSNKWNLTGDRYLGVEVIVITPNKVQLKFHDEASVSSTMLTGNEFLNLYDLLNKAREDVRSTTYKPNSGYRAYDNHSGQYNSFECMGTKELGWEITICSHHHKPHVEFKLFDIEGGRFLKDFHISMEIFYMLLELIRDFREEYLERKVGELSK